MIGFWPRFAIVALLCGCGATTPAPPRHSARSLAATLDIRFRDNAPWPYRVQRLVVVLDGEVLYQRSLPSFPPTLPVAYLPDLPTGDHTLEVLVELRYPTGTLGTSCILEARRAKSFTATGHPTNLTLDVYSSGVTESFSERVQLWIAMNGDGAPTHFETYSYDRDDPCT